MCAGVIKRILLHMHTLSAVGPDRRPSIANSPMGVCGQHRTAARRQLSNRGDDGQRRYVRSSHCQISYPAGQSLKLLLQFRV